MYTEALECVVVPPLPWWWGEGEDNTSGGEWVGRIAVAVWRSVIVSRLSSPRVAASPISSSFFFFVWFSSSSGGPKDVPSPPSARRRQMRSKNRFSTGAFSFVVVDVFPAAAMGEDALEVRVWRGGRAKRGGDESVAGDKQGGATIFGCRRASSCGAVGRRSFGEWWRWCASSSPPLSPVVTSLFSPFGDIAVVCGRSGVTSWFAEAREGDGGFSGDPTSRERGGIPCEEHPSDP